jgi:hypothetical protein
LSENNSSATLVETNTPAEKRKVVNSNTDQVKNSLTFIMKKFSYFYRDRVPRISVLNLTTPPRHKPIHPKPAKIVHIFILAKPLKFLPKEILFGQSFLGGFYQINSNNEFDIHAKVYFQVTFHFKN